MNNNMIKQMNQNQILQTIQNNNEQIIQMIQQIFQIQLSNNMLLNKILTNNFNNNINNKMNNFVNNMNMMKNFNIQNMMNNNIMNMVNNRHFIDPWEGNNKPRIGLYFQLNDGSQLSLNPPENITVKELIEGFIKMYNLEGRNFRFIFNSNELKNDDCRIISDNLMLPGSKVFAAELGEVLGALKYI